jgi:hypothetical protein
MYGSRSSQHDSLVVWPLLTLLLALSGPGALPAAADDKHWSPPPLTGPAGEAPDPRDLIRRAIDFVEGHQRLGFEAVVTYEVVQTDGQKLQFDMLHRVAVESKARVHWVTLYDNATKETAWCGDGTFTLLREPANIWGRVEVPAALSEALLSVSKDYNITVPFVDLLAGDASKLWLGEDVEWVNYVGEAWAEGAWTDHVALRRKGADVQIWFRTGKKPFPVKMTIVLTEDASLPTFTARFKRWSDQIPDGAVPKFVPPKGAQQIEVVPVTAP